MSRTAVFPLRDYDLAATLTSGQAFRWREANGPVIEWENIIAGRWVRLHVKDKQLHAQTAKPQKDWQWLTDYLQLEVNLKKILAAFPKDDPHLAAARKTCRGLRLLKQDPWETLAGFICSSNKRIVQIQQIIADLCDRFGEPIPTNGRLANLSHCRPPCFIDRGRPARLPHGLPRQIPPRHRHDDRPNQIDLPAIAALNYEPAKAELQRLPGIGPKVADCILLFAYAHPQAFPLDTWIIKALRQLYFPRRNPTPKQLQTFIQKHFAPHHGYAQQYLFHHVRTQGGLLGETSEE